MSKRYLRPKSVAARYGINLATVWRWVNSGRLPKPYALGPNVTGFCERELDARDAEIAAQRDGKAA